MLHDDNPTPRYGFPALSRDPGGDSRTYVTHQTLADARANDGSNFTRIGSGRNEISKSRDPLGIAAIIRMQRDRDFLATIAEWQRASGEDRAYWRRYVRIYIAEERAHQRRCAAALRAAAIRQRRRDAT